MPSLAAARDTVCGSCRPPRSRLITRHIASSVYIIHVNIFFSRREPLRDRLRMAPDIDIARLSFVAACDLGTIRLGEITLEAGR